MRYRKLGTTGVEVSTQCLGTMMFGAMGNDDHDECVSIIQAALEQGINFIDTADRYSLGESEVIVGKALKGRRDEVVLATKFLFPMGEDRNHQGGSRRWIMQAVENSLTRLGTDYIDLYQIHLFDWDTELDETLSALSDLIHQGKILYAGCSNFPAEQIVEAQWTSARRNRERFVCLQPPYSIFTRSIETSVLPTCQRHAMGVIPWSPLDGGWLAGKYRRGQAVEAGSRFTEGTMWSQRNAGAVDTNVDPKIELVERLAVVAEKAGLNLMGLGLGFTDAHPAISSTIIGPRTMEQLEGLLSVAHVVLDDDTLDAIDGICPPGTNAPGTVDRVPNPNMDVVHRRR